MTTSSNAVEQRFAELRSAGRRALVVYVTAGFPDTETSRRLLHELPAAGADVIEVGVPFSDPLADGPTIQASSQRALENGFSLDSTLALVSSARPAAPTVLFTYLNPLLAAGADVYERIKGAGIAGVLVTDLPVGADPPLESTIADSGLAFIRLVAPTTPAERVAEIARVGSGFVYVISRLGVTGARGTLSSTIGETVQRVRAVTEMPVCVGFGVSTPEQAAAVAQLADGVIVGSALVDAAGRSVDEALSLTAALREALDG